MAADISLERSVLAISSVPRVVVPVARTLKRRGLTVHGAVVGNRDPIRSRAFSSFTNLPTPDQGRADDFRKALWQLIGKYQIGTIIPCGDDILQAVAYVYDELRSAGIHLTCPEPSVFEKVLNKEVTLSIAESLGIPVPHTYELPSVADLESMRSAIRFPVVVKPRNKHYEALTRIRVQVVSSYSALHELFELYEEFGRGFLIQEYIPGRGVGIEILMNGNEPHVLFQHRRVREVPYAGGVSVAAESETVDPSLSAMAVALLRALHWQGVAMVEYRQDLHTGALALMEVNGRFWGSMALSYHLGLEFPWYAWQLANGIQPQPAPSYRTGIRFRWLLGDFRRLREVVGLWRSGKITSMHLAKELGVFCRDFLPPVYDALWSWYDPRPAVDEILHAASESMSLGFRRVISAMLPAEVSRWIRRIRPLGLKGALLYLKLSFFGTRSNPAATLSSSGVKSIVFICHGNIIRSPLGEYAMREQLARRGVRDVNVSSAGLFAVPDRPADARACTVAGELGYDLTSHRAQLLTADIVRNTDLFVVMDYLNYVRITNVFPEVKNKVILLGSCSPDRSGGEQISDPYYGDDTDIRACYVSMSRCISTLADAFAPLPTTSRYDQVTKRAG